MSGPPALRRRRSNLAVPASSPKMIERAAGSQADQVFLDLEDACAPAEKAPARANVVTALRELDFGTTIRAVRVNDVTTSWCHADITEIVSGAGATLDCIVVPKVEDASHVHFVDHLLGGLEGAHGLTRRIGLELQIESPTGAVNLREISRASDRIETIIFGPGDYAATLGVAQFDIGMIDERYPGHQWHWVMAEIAAHARSVGAQAIDGPYVDFRDEAGYRASAQLARLLGYDGKWCIHPNQLEWANEAFAPSAAELEQATRILAAYAEAQDAGLGATALDGKLIDEATRKVAQRTLARAGKADPARSGTDAH